MDREMIFILPLFLLALALVVLSVVFILQVRKNKELEYAVYHDQVTDIIQIRN